MTGVNARCLIAWRKPMRLVDEIDRLAHRLPLDEKFGLNSKQRRALAVEERPL